MTKERAAAGTVTLRVYRPEVVWSVALVVAALACSDDPTTKAVSDAATKDATTSDANVASSDAAVLDGAIKDASADAMPDEGTLDAGPDAAQLVDAGDPNLIGYDGPADLASAGLYQPGGEVLAAGLVAYAPRFVLWSDGAKKRRFLSLPAGTTIDTSDMDQWVFPLGTRVFKEFTAIDPKSGAEVRVETRLLEKRSDGWLAVSFVWNAAQTEALPAPRGMKDVLGTNHDIPSQEDCKACHAGNRDFLLGIDAIQLSHAGGLASGGDLPEMTLAQLRTNGLLSNDPGTDAFVLPGDESAQAALGMLHANCGSCHQPGTLAFDRTDLELRLSTQQLGAVTDTATFKTSVGVNNQKRFDEWPLRIAAGDSQGSAMVGRMLSREPLVAMPPLGTELPDTDGAATLSTWINSL